MTSRACATLETTGPQGYAGSTESVTGVGVLRYPKFGPWKPVGVTLSPGKWNTSSCDIPFIYKLCYNNNSKNMRSRTPEHSKNSYLVSDAGRPNAMQYTTNFIKTLNIIIYTFKQWGDDHPSTIAFTILKLT